MKTDLEKRAILWECLTMAVHKKDLRESHDYLSKLIDLQGDSYDENIIE